MLKEIKEGVKEILTFIKIVIGLATLSTVVGWGFANGFFSYFGTQEALHQLVGWLWH